MSNHYFFFGTRTTFMRAVPKIFCRVNGALVSYLTNRFKYSIQFHSESFSRSKFNWLEPDKACSCNLHKIMLYNFASAVISIKDLQQRFVVVTKTQLEMRIKQGLSVQRHALRAPSDVLQTTKAPSVLLCCWLCRCSVPEIQGIHLDFFFFYFAV